LENARGLLTEAVSSLLMVEQAKFARLKASLRLLAFRFASLQSVLTRKFLPAFGYCRLETASRAVSAGKEVVRMKYFKITKTWAVKAESEAEAIKLIAADPVKYLDSETVTRTEYKKPQPKTGWGTAVKEQLLGSNSKR
jgi:hypothetical protein